MKQSKEVGRIDPKANPNETREARLTPAVVFDLTSGSVETHWLDYDRLYTRANP